MQKRKKSASGSFEPTKKRKKTPSSPSLGPAPSPSPSSKPLSVEVVSCSLQEAKPLVIDFPNAPPPPSVLKSDAIDWNLFQDMKATRRRQIRPVALRGETAGMEWEGKCFEVKEKEFEWSVDRKSLLSKDKEKGKGRKKDKTDTEKEKSKDEKINEYFPVEEVSKTMIGIYSKKTGRVEIYEVPPVIHLYQHVKGFDTSAQGEKDTATYQQKQMQLVELFGSKKKRLEQRQKSATDISSLTYNDISNASEMDSILGDLAVKDADLLGEALDSSLLPPFDAKTNVSSEIYPIAQIISEEEEEKLNVKHIMKCVKSKSLLAELKKESPDSCISSPDLSHYYPPFVFDAISYNLQRGGTKSERKQRARIVLYAAYLMRFYGFALQRKKGKDRTSETICSVNDVASFSTQLDVPSVIITKMLETFCEKRKAHMAGGPAQRFCYCLPKQAFQKLTNYVLVFYLTLNNYEVSFDQACSFMFQSRDILRKNFFSLGCVSRKGKKEAGKNSVHEGETKVMGHWFALKAPLKIHTLKKRGKK